MYDDLKRGIDVAGALVLLVLVGPVLLAVAALVRVTMGAPVLYRQLRIGRSNVGFTLLKFRTMRPPRTADEPDGARLTPVGRILRATSLDELPQLWNVLRGDMSLVGPRPLLPEYLARYSREQRRRHEVRPGITGLAQVSGRNAVTWEERLALDVWYVDHASIAGDLAILWRTLGCLARREGIAAAGHATMPPFEGTRCAS